MLSDARTFVPLSNVAKLPFAEPGEQSLFTYAFPERKAVAHGRGHEQPAGFQGISEKGKAPSRHDQLSWNSELRKKPEVFRGRVRTFPLFAGMAILRRTVYRAAFQAIGKPLAIGY